MKKEEKWVILQRMLYAHKVPGNIPAPSPREAANFSGKRPDLQVGASVPSRRESPMATTVHPGKHNGFQPSKWQRIFFFPPKSYCIEGGGA